MPDRRSVNRSMFWRVLRRSIFANRGRLFVILLALGAGSAVTAALLNLQVDAKRRINEDFSSLGPPVVIVPRTGSTLPEATLDQPGIVLFHPEASLFVVARVSIAARPDQGVQVVINGSTKSQVVNNGSGRLEVVEPPRRVHAPSSETQPAEAWQQCIVGSQAAERLDLKVGNNLALKKQDRQERCAVAVRRAEGDADDGRIILSLGAAQRLAKAPGQVSVIESHLSRNSMYPNAEIAQLQSQLPGLEVRARRPFSQAQVRIYQKISGILSATIAIVLVLTALCVMAAMTNIAAERKNDVGLMKAIGGSVRRVMRIFVAEAALLGLAGGLIGAAAGIAISIGLGKAVFGVAAHPRLIVYPVSVALTVIVSILAAYPLRQLAHVRPAYVFRGEE